MKFINFLLIFASGFIMIRYSKWITDNTMRFPSVEKFFGPGGTYTFWKIAGVAAIAISFYYLLH